MNCFLENKFVKCLEDQTVWQVSNVIKTLLGGVFTISCDFTLFYPNETKVHHQIFDLAMHNYDNLVVQIGDKHYCFVKRPRDWYDPKESAMIRHVWWPLFYLGQDFKKWLLSNME